VSRVTSQAERHTQALAFLKPSCTDRVLAIMVHARLAGVCKYLQFGAELRGYVDFHASDSANQEIVRTRGSSTSDIERRGDVGH
jgi:hypothetical protein